MPPKIDLRRLPPLKALKGFEAATRHQSIRDAAAELCLTHPAISHQVHLIEQTLGVPLFEQSGRHIVSTEAGRVFYPHVRAAFESLLEGVEAVRRHALDQPLRVQTYVTASIRWLARRVPQFLAQHPDIRLTLSTCAVDWEFDDRHADVGLIYCENPPDPDRFDWLPLFPYELFAVCSPGFRSTLGKGAGLADLAASRLIAIYTEERNWQAWFAAAGIDFQQGSSMVMVDTLAVALEMALDGEGVALVNGPFVDHDLQAGRLVIAADHRLRCPGEWGLICRRESRSNPRVATFFDWIAAEARMPPAPAPA